MSIFVSIIVIEIKIDHNAADILTEVMHDAIIIKRPKTMGYRDEVNLSKLHKNLQSG